MLNVLYLLLLLFLLNYFFLFYVFLNFHVLHVFCLLLLTQKSVLYHFLLLGLSWRFDPSRMIICYPMAFFTNCFANDLVSVRLVQSEEIGYL